MLSIRSRFGLKLSRFIIVCSLLLESNIGFAGPEDQARRLYNNLNGVPPTQEEVTKMVELIEANQYLQAGLIAIDAPHKSFYKTTLRGLVNIWSNESRSGRFALTDLQATVMGMTRDDVPFDEALYGDIVYTIDDDTLPEYSRNNNDHYQDGSEDGKEFFEKLVRRKQSEVSGLSPQVASGLFTTRGFAAAYYVAGTNRAALRFSMMNFMCRDMEQLSDISRHDYRVRQDVDRAPGGDPATYKSKCVGCHAGMDALAGAFAYMDFDDDGRFIYNPLRPRSKFTVNNNTFKDGFVTEDNTWINLWVDGPNSVLGWRGAATGKGVKSYGSMLAATEQFSSCMAEQALKVTCRPDENDPNYKTAVKHLAQNFEQGGYNLKHLFVKSALTCRGE